MQTKLRRCLHAIDQSPIERHAEMLTLCLAELKPLAPGCNEAMGGWAKAPPERRLDETVKACARAHCGRLTAPRPKLCSAAKVNAGPAATAEVLEFFARLLIPALSLGDQPELAAKLVGRLTALVPLSVTMPDPVPAPGSPGQAQTQLHLIVRTDGRVELDGRALGFDQLGKALARRHRLDPEAKVLIQSDARAPYRHIVRTLEAARATGFKNFALAVRRD